MEQDRSGGFLPPEPPGPEPELGHAPPTSSPPPPSQGQPPPAYGWPQQPPYPPPWTYAQPVREPDNGPAVAGFVLSLVSVGLLFFSAGLSTIISIGCAVAGLAYSRKGKRKVEAGETRKSSGLAQAGYIISIVGLVLSIVATGAWVLILVLASADDDPPRFDDSQSIRASLRITGAAMRVAAHLLG